MLNQHQKAIAHHYSSTKDNIAVLARAGTGKTSLLLAINKLRKSQSGLFLAFTNATKDELIKRDPTLANRVKTTYSIGFKACARFIESKVEVSQWKYSEIVEDIIREDSFKAMCLSRGLDPKAYTGRNITKDLVDLVHGALLNLKFQQSDIEDYVKLNFELNPDVESFLVFEAVKIGLNDCLNGVITFADMISFPFSPYVSGEDLSGLFDQYSVVFVDEAQDLSMAQIRIVEETSRGGQLVIVGDRNQCQPEGTLVTCVTGESNKTQVTYQKPIEDLKIGDTVLAPSLRDSAYYRRKVLDIASREVGEVIYTFTTESNQSSYTANHKVLVNFKPFVGMYYVYLMQQGDLFRVGKSQLKDNQGPSRSSQEKADKMWILGWYSSDQDALDAEWFFAWEFGIPTVMFEERQNVRYAGVLGKFWASLSPLEGKVRTLLGSLGLFLEYPLMDYKQGKQQSLKRPLVTYACNVSTGALVLEYKGVSKFNKTHWQPVEVFSELYRGKVYSLKIEQGLYIADNIATHNCIFGFAGATGNSFDYLVDSQNCKVFDMPLCYRCPIEVLDKAREIVPDIQGLDRHGLLEEVLGVGEGLKLLEDLSHEKEKTIVASRTNVKLLSCAIFLLESNIPFNFHRDAIEGKIKGRVSYIKDTTPFQNFRGSVEAQLQDAVKKRNQSQVDLLECILLILQKSKATKYSEFFAYMRKIFFKRKANFLLGTVHSFKGNEESNVVAWGIEDFPHRLAVTDEELEQEENLLYVLITRAKDRLYLVDTSEG